MTGSERRGEGGRTEEVLRIMEGELREWCGKSGRLEEGYYHSTSVHGLGRVLDPTPIDEGQWSKPTAETTLPDLPTHSHSSTPVPATAPPTLTELSRTPHSLLWLLPSPHTRYLAHVLARYYSLTSFSRPLSPLEPSIRVTHIARPHLVNPLEGRGVEVLGLETPPGTDWSDVGGGGGTTTGGEEMTSGSEIERRRGGEMGTDTDTDSEAGDWESLGRGRGRGPLAVGEEVVLVSSSGRDWAPSEFESSEEGGTGDEASSFGDEDELEEEGGVDSLASSFADLRARVDQDDEEEEDDPTPNPTRTTTLPFTSLPPDFALHSGSSTPRPLPLRARLPRESFPPPSATSSTVPTRPAPVPRGVSTDSSSWEKDASPVMGMGRLVGGGGRQAQGQGQGWSMPEKTFGEWLFA